MSRRKILWGKVFLLLVLPIAVITMVIIFCCRGCEHRGEMGYVEEMEDEEVIEPQYLYGICIDSMYVEEGEIGSGQFLSTLLCPKGVSPQVVDHIARNEQDVFDVRKMRAGNRYSLLMTNDSLMTPLFWIYEIDYKNTAVFSLTDSLTAWRIERDIVTRIERTSGTITSSLWNAIVQNGGDPALAVKLSDIYAWTIDFFGIQDGDAFEAFYEHNFVEDQPVGLGRVLFCNFIHIGDTICAVAFEQNGKVEYFNEEGENLRKAFLKAPLNYSRISSKFSNSRYHPVLKYYRPHHGVDYAAPAGTPVYSIGDGVVVTKAYQSGGAGNYLKIKHNDTYTTSYMHLKGFAKDIKQGSRVKQGQLIGYVGSTGVSTGPHLDFRVFKNGTPIDPLKMDSPPAEPVQKSDKDRFGKLLKYWQVALQSEGVPEPYDERAEVADTVAMMAP